MRWREWNPAYGFANDKRQRLVHAQNCNYFIYREAVEFSVSNALTVKPELKVLFNYLLFVPRGSKPNIMKSHTSGCAPCYSNLNFSNDVLPSCGN